MNDNSTTNPDNTIPTPPTKVIYSYTFTLPDDGFSVCISMPEGAQILSLHGTRMWALVDPNNPEVERKFFVLRTGVAVANEELGVCIGKIFKSSVGDGSGTVYHVFDCAPGATTMQLTPELKRWLLHKVQRELVSARSNASISAAVSVLGGSSMNTNEVDMLEALESQLKH